MKTTVNIELEHVMHDADKAPKTPVTIEIGSQLIVIGIKGYSCCNSVDQAGVILVELYNGVPRVHIYGDINQEDPTFSIDLGGAAESKRLPAPGEMQLQCKGCGAEIIVSPGKTICVECETDAKRNSEPDDVCDKCMRSGVEVSRVEDGKTICVECDE